MCIKLIADSKVSKLQCVDIFLWNGRSKSIKEAQDFFSLFSVFLQGIHDYGNWQISWGHFFLPGAWGDDRKQYLIPLYWSFELVLLFWEIFWSDKIMEPSKCDVQFLGRNEIVHTQIKALWHSWTSSMVSSCSKKT